MENSFGKMIGMVFRGKLISKFFIWYFVIILLKVPSEVATISRRRDKR
jgi:hypothetical protein